MLLSSLRFFLTKCLQILLTGPSASSGIFLPRLRAGLETGGEDVGCMGLLSWGARDRKDVTRQYLSTDYVVSAVLIWRSRFRYLDRQSCAEHLDPCRALPWITAVCTWLIHVGFNYSSFHVVIEGNSTKTVPNYVDFNSRYRDPKWPRFEHKEGGGRGAPQLVVYKSMVDYLPAAGSKSG